MGRRKGSRNRGYFYRSGRGWAAIVDGRIRALEYENGDRMQDKATPVAEVRAAYRRLMAKPDDELDEGLTDDPTVADVCSAYLTQVQATGAKSTLRTRTATLFDFCFGLPYKFAPIDGKKRPKPKASDHIHDGFGRLHVSKLLPIHLDRWFQKHPTWKGAKRSKIQAVKRALNYGVESGLIEANPIKGYKTPKQRGRVTYITPEQEQALGDVASPALAMAIKVCIRTGARPGCEFAALTAAHVTDGDRMTWTFKAEESKTKNLRIVYITDPEIIGIVRKQMKRHRTGPIFRAPEDGPWTRELLSEKFRNAKRRLEENGVKLDDDACMYSCRHTYAKRVLQGFWSGKATNIETLARLMGNSPQVCRDHYLQWCDHYSEPLWESA